MPSFKDKLTGAQIEALADYLAEPEVARYGAAGAARTSAAPAPW